MEAQQRYDVAIFSTRARLRISPLGARSLLQFMNANGHITGALHSAGDGWEEIHASPGDFAHALFHDGPSTGVAPVFLEMGLRFGAAPLDLGYGPAEPVHFYLELRGAAFDTVTDAFLERVDDILYARPAYATRLHTSLRARDELQGDQPPEDRRKRKPDRSDGRIGVSVEER